MPTVTAGKAGGNAIWCSTRSPSGLTSRQAWTLEHIVRCPACGCWMTVTDRALRDGEVPAGAICRHFEAAP